MSGRLVILPKKSYCPWNSANVERVLRDERIEKERLEQQEQQEQQHQSQQRLKSLKRKNKEETQPQQHVNLFEAEEHAMVQKALTGSEDGSSKKKKGIMPVVLGETELKNRGDNCPFYMRSSSRGTRVMGEELCNAQDEKEEKRKASMDPMQGFVKEHNEQVREHEEKVSGRKRASGSTSYHHKVRHDDDDSCDNHRERKRRGKKRRRHKKKHGDERKRKHKRSDDSTEEVRRRRVEREQHESLREASLMQRNSTKRSIGGHYQDQYNPGLSRN